MYICVINQPCRCACIATKRTNVTGLASSALITILCILLVYVYTCVLYYTCALYRSDDMTGQFTLAALEEEDGRLDRFSGNFCRVSDQDQGVSPCIYWLDGVCHDILFLQPTDYYDDQVKKEEEVGNVCMVRVMWSLLVHSNPCTLGTEESVMIIEASWLLRCPDFRVSWLDTLKLQGSTVYVEATTTNLYPKPALTCTSFIEILHVFIDHIVCCRMIWHQRGYFSSD